MTPILGSIAGKTIGELIGSLKGINGKSNLAKFGKIILGITDSKMK